MIKAKPFPTKRNASAAFVAVACSLALAPLALAQRNDGVPREVENVTVEQRLGERLPLAVPLVDSSGREVTLGNYFGKNRPVIVTLNYSDCPMLCTVQLDQLSETLDKLPLRLGQDFDIVTVSIDPRETTRRNRETRDKYIALLPNQPAAAEGWHFTTAPQTSITLLAEALGFQYRYDRQTKEYYHPAMLAFISPEGVITRYSLDVSFPPDQMRLALIEASEGTIGSKVDQFVLWCFSYDPDRNSYVLQAWRLMRLGGAVTVVVLLATLTPYWIGRRRVSRPVVADGAV